MANPWDEYAAPAAAPPGPWKAYDRRAAPPPKIDPSEGMSGGEKFLVGAGSSLNKAWEGLSDPFVGEETRKSRKEDRELYARNRPGGMGTVGEVVGDIAAYAPLALVPGGLAVQAGAGALGSAAMTPGDAGERAGAAAMGAAGAGAGHVLTKALGRVAKPIGDKTADVLALEARGIEPTFGQSMASKGGLGKAVGRFEEAAQSMPVGGTPLRNSRQRSMDQWQRATRAETLPPGAPAAAAESVDSARQAFTQAYTDTLDSVPMPYAAVQYAPDMRTLSQGMPITQAQRDLVEQTVSQIRLKHMSNPTPGVQATAAGAHGAESDLKALARRYGSSQDPAQQDLGRLFGNVADEFGQAWRSALPADTRNAIGAIDSQYPGFTATREAAKKVGTGASGGDPNAYTPSVLLRAGRQVDRTPNKTRYLAGEAPLQELAGQGQRVLGDKMPDSGTMERLAWGAGGLGSAFLNLPATMGAVGATAGYGTRPVQQYLTGRAAPEAQQFMLELLRRGAPYGAAAGASQSN